MQDCDTPQVYRLYDFSKTPLIQPDVAYCVAGKVDSAIQLPRDRIGPPGYETSPGCRIR
jgi:hypothetical protein